MIPDFDWDLAKARENERKHGVTFEEAATVFADDDAVIYDDVDHSDREDRFIIIVYRRASTCCSPSTRYG